MKLVSLNKLTRAITALYTKVEKVFATKKELENGLDTKSDASHVHADANTISNGFMSKDDKSKLDSISTGAQKNSDITKTEIENKLTGTITSHNHNYLPLTGGTINGNLTLNQGFKVHNAAGTHGTGGYVKVAEIKITSNYQNQSVYFLISQRGKQISTLEIQFTNINNSDPNLYRFYRTGEIEAYMHKTGTGIWDLYITKAESYDNIDILDFRKGSYMNGFTVTWTNIQASSVPSGAIATTIKPDENIGSLSSLSTSNKTNVVSAINEVNNKLGNGLSQLTDLYNDTINYL